VKIFFNRYPRQEPYGGGNQFLKEICALLQREGHEVVFQLNPGVDVIFLIDPRPGDVGYSVNHALAYKKQNPGVKILHRVNECDKRKDTDFMDTLLLKTMELADEVVFISDWLQEYFLLQGGSKKGHVVYNGCSRRDFYPVEDKTIRLKPRVVTHHWSDNWLKGFDVYTEIDKYLQQNDSFEFTYVGRYNKEYTPRATNIVEPLFGQALGNELRGHDIYLTASRWEPCGMHHIEGAACGLPVLYHSDTGGIKELCKNHGEEFKTFDELLKKIELVSSEYSHYTGLIDHNRLDIDYCCSVYHDIIRAMIE